MPVLRRPRHADIVLITGPLTTRVRDRVLAVWNEIPSPRSPWPWASAPSPAACSAKALLHRGPHLALHPRGCERARLSAPPPGHPGRRGAGTQDVAQKAGHRGINGQGKPLHRLAVWLGLRDAAPADGTAPLDGASPAAETTSGDKPCRRCGICHHVCGLIPRTPKARARAEE